MICGIHLINVKIYEVANIQHRAFNPNKRSFPLTSHYQTTTNNQVSMRLLTHNQLTQLTTVCTCLNFLATLISQPYRFQKAKTGMSQ